MTESSVNVTLGVGEVIKEVKDTKTIEEVDKTSALVVRAIHVALSPLEKWVLQKEYNLAELNREPDTFLEGIINNNMRRKVYDEYMNLHFIIEFADGEEKTVKINDMFEISNIEFVRKDD